MLLPFCKTGSACAIALRATMAGRPQAYRLVLALLMTVVLAVAGCQEPEPIYTGRQQSLRTAPYRRLARVLPAPGAWRTVRDPDLSMFGKTGTIENVTEPRSHWGQIAHHVRKGDTLYRLSLEYYGDAKYWREIFEQNRMILRSSSNHLRAGQKLYLPVRTETGGLASGVMGKQPCYYVVGQGDTLVEIARKLLGNAGRYREIVPVNGRRWADPNQIKPGTLVWIPGE